MQLYQPSMLEKALVILVGHSGPVKLGQLGRLPHRMLNQGDPLRKPPALEHPAGTLDEDIPIFFTKLRSQQDRALLLAQHRRIHVSQYFKVGACCQVDEDHAIAQGLTVYPRSRLPDCDVGVPPHASFTVGELVRREA